MLLEAEGMGVRSTACEGGSRARAIAIWQASCELEIVPSLHSNLGGVASATGAEMDDDATAGCGAGACATDFSKAAQPAHENNINNATAERICVPPRYLPRPMGLADLSHSSGCRRNSIQWPGMIRTHAGRGDSVH